jgi:hypothetical protein
MLRTFLFLPLCGSAMRLRTILFACLIATVPAGCALHGPASSTAAGTAPSLQGDPAHPGATKGWVETKLYFGLGPADNLQQGISETEWRKFLDREVTPRFPAGLSVVDAYGQWQGKDEHAAERLRSKMLVIDYPDSEENRAKIEAIRTAWKRKTGDQSVMRATEPVDVSF